MFLPVVHSLSIVAYISMIVVTINSNRMIQLTTVCDIPITQS